MKFFYQLERYELGKYVKVILKEGEYEGIGAILPERNQGENYKVIMGVIEEYRHVVEKARPEHFGILSYKLKNVFPKHPKVSFAISVAAVELYCKLLGMNIYEFFFLENMHHPIHLDNWEGEVVVPELQGGVFEALSLSDKNEKALYIRKYPKEEMKEVLHALSCYFAGYVTG